MLKWLKQILRRIYRFFEGAYRTAQLHDAASSTYTEAERAVARVLRESGLPDDCVSATVINGGPAIVITHAPTKRDRKSEAFVHVSYARAADKALEWLKSEEVNVGGVSGYNREQRRIAKAQRKRDLRKKAGLK